LVAVKDAEGNLLKGYAYDGLHRRIQETAGGVTTDLYYSDAWQVLEERVGGQTTVQYVWSPVYVDALVLRDRDSDGDGTLDERLYVVQDANYNITALLDNAGNVVERYVYDPFGQATILDANWTERAASAFAWVYLHQGGRFDTTSGLYHFRHRDYSPTLGRWTSLDPLRYDAGDVNLYRVVFNAPTNFTDPSGQLFWIPFLIGAAVVAGGIGGLHVAANRYDAATATLTLPPSPEREALFQSQLTSAQWWEAGSYTAIYTGGGMMTGSLGGYVGGYATAAGYGKTVAVIGGTATGLAVGNTAYQTYETPWSQLNGPQTLQAAGTIYGPWVGGFLTGPTAFHSGYTAGEAARTAPTFMRSMTPTEAARYLTYWQNMEAPVQVGPGWTTRLVDVVPSSQPGGGVYTRIAYYDRFGRMVGRTDVGHHGRPNVHPVPHHHIYDPLYPPSQMPSGGIRIPGSDPPSSVWPGFHPLEQTPIFLQPRVPPYSPLFGGPFQPNLLFLRPSPSDRVLIYDRDF
jgi:RHS repeat-associated protein